MQDKEFLQANKVFTGKLLHDNKEKGLDVSHAREAIEKEWSGKVVQWILSSPAWKKNNTEVLLHKNIFWHYFTTLEDVEKKV